MAVRNVTRFLVKTDRVHKRTKTVPYWPRAPTARDRVRLRTARRPRAQRFANAADARIAVRNVTSAAIETDPRVPGGP